MASLVVMVALMRLDYRHLRRFSVLFAGIALVLLVLVPACRHWAVPQTVNHSARWPEDAIVQIHPGRGRQTPP